MFDLYDVLQKDTQLLEKEFNEQIREKTKTITDEINSRLNLNSILQYNGSFRDLFNALEFGTDSGKIMLSDRGDGMQVRHIPIILQNMAEAELADFGMREPCANTIWVFEEPENNLEFGSAKKLADTFLEYVEKIHFQDDRHSKFDEGIQIFISTHSPIFYSLEGVRINKIFVEKDDSEHSFIKPIPTDLKSRRDLEKNMGLDPLLGLSHKWSELSSVISSQKSKLDELELKLEQLSRPVLITEGKTDQLILETAWQKLYPLQERSFDIIPADTRTDNEGGNGGAGVLSNFANAVRPDDNKRIVLWDYDKDGISGFKLNKNFNKLKDYSWIKSHVNKKSYGMIIPYFEDLKEYYDAQNMPIEYLFDKEDILRKDDNDCGIKLDPEVVKRDFGAIKKEFVCEEECLFRIAGDKLAFAQNIVPDLPSESFNRFRVIFDGLIEIVNG